MKAFLLSFALVIGTLASVQAKKPDENKFIGYCANYGTGVSSLYASCVNSNFSSIQRDLNAGIFFSCMNFGSEVEYSFTSCIDSNFRQAERLLSGKVYLSACYNYDRKTLDYSYISCVNNNFNQIDFALRK